MNTSLYLYVYFIIFFIILKTKKSLPPRFLDWHTQFFQFSLNCLILINNNRCFIFVRRTSLKVVVIKPNRNKYEQQKKKRTSVGRYSGRNYMFICKYVYFIILFVQSLGFLFGDILQQLVLLFVLVAQPFALVDEPLHVVRVELTQATIFLLLVAKVLLRLQTFAILNALLSLIRLQLVRFPFLNK